MEIRKESSYFFQDIRNRVSIKKVEDITKEVAWEFFDEAVMMDNLPLAEDASDWFFIIMPKSRMGSTVLQNILSTHPQIFCSGENYYPTLLPYILNATNFRLLTEPYSTPIFLQNYDGFTLHPNDIQEILRIIRKRMSNKEFFGFKYILWDLRHLDKILPNAKYIMTVRNPLDACNSEIAQDWCLWKPSNDDDYFWWCYKWIKEALSATTKLRNRSLIVEFEKMKDEDYCRNILRKCIIHIGADPDIYDYEDAIKGCLHKNTKNNWKQNDSALRFMKRLKDKDRQMYDIIDADLWYIPEDLKNQEKVGLSEE